MNQYELGDNRNYASESTELRIISSQNKKNPVIKQNINNIDF